MAMNTSKVLVGGLAAGVVLNVIDWATYGYIFADRMKAATEAFKPGLSDSMMSGNAIAIYVITDFVFGILLVWTYAAIRPRFGPGARTAMAAAILFWIIVAFTNAGYIQMGMMNASLWWTFAVIGLVNFILAAWLGARLYTEEGTMAAA